ncbi:hypothetical protein G5C51_23860 [Streptomyces sp. A7024]|uniref:Uncharacterized protein n=1 Tax=Streptomyces coryli TaxID=1128680 RepID=A0A6G4U3W5_9ACTN|nr:hypothetical protein [Streptomyces coryli]
MTDPLEGPGIRRLLEDTTKDGDAAVVAGMAVTLGQRHAKAAQRADELSRSVKHAARVLALTPGEENVRALLSLLTDLRGDYFLPRLDQRHLASLLAEAQSEDDLFPVFADDPSGGGVLSACLFHEMVLRGADGPELKRRTGWRLSGSWHPGLAWLPDERADMERSSHFPSRRYNGEANGGTSIITETTARLDPPTPRTTGRPDVVEVTTPELHEDISGPPREGGWSYEARSYRTAAPVAPADLPAVLAGLPLLCLTGLGPSDRFAVAPCGLEDVWELLFTTASLGVFGGSGVHGAYGRLSAWRSIAGLAGAPTSTMPGGIAGLEAWPEAATPEAVLEAAAACTWLRFEADSEWFYNDMYADYGIATLSPDGRRIAVVAATTTD